VAGRRRRPSSPSTFAGYDIAYDKVDNIVYEEWSHASGAGHTYAYDKANRLRTWKDTVVDPSAEHATPNSSTWAQKVEYNLSDDSDRTSVVTTPYGSGSSTANYTSNSLHAYTVIASVNRSHDANGNLTFDGTLDYAYDYKNNLVSATDTAPNPDVVEGAYEYDALNRRIGVDKPGEYLRTFHAGLHELQVFDGGGSLQRTFVYKDGIDSVSFMEARDIADLDADTNTSEFVRLYYHLDPRSNVAYLTDANEDVAESYAYTPYGERQVLDQSGNPVAGSQVGNPFGFQRRNHDEETGLIHFRHRAYDPVAGHWLQRDPLGLDPGANPREFVGSSPTNRTDPLGLKDVAEQAAEATIAAALAIAQASALAAGASNTLANIVVELRSMLTKPKSKEPATAKPEDPAPPDSASGTPTPPEENDPPEAQAPEDKPRDLVTVGDGDTGTDEKGKHNLLSKVLGEAPYAWGLEFVWGLGFWLWLGFTTSSGVASGQWVEWRPFDEDLYDALIDLQDTDE
jgi:RHS repeat-associated protein